MIGLPVLARFAARTAVAPATARCEVCGGALRDPHRHVVERGVRGIQCACQACGILFSRGAAGTRFRTIPDRVLVGELALTPQRWAELGVPVALAFCYRDSSKRAGVVCYPGPAGVIEGDLEPGVWDAIVAATPLAAQLEEDVEALLVRGGRGATSLACYLIPISAGYELVGRLRHTWEGFSGGERADHELETFFADLDRRGERT